MLIKKKPQGEAKLPANLTPRERKQIRDIIEKNRREGKLPNTAQQEEQEAIFGEWCSFLNFFDRSIHFELTFLNMAADQEEDVADGSEEEPVCPYRH